MNSITPKSKRGGKRPGAGRKPGSRNVATSDDIKDLGREARGYSKLAIQTLARIAKEGESEAARVSAAIHILDRGYGKATERVEHSGIDGAAIQVNEETTIEDRSMNEIARRVAFLLHKGMKAAAKKDGAEE